MSIHKELFTPLAEVSKKISDATLSPTLLTEASLQRIQDLDPVLNSFLSVSRVARREAARAAGSLRQGHCRGPLHGIPISIKDIILTREMPTTGGSKAPLDQRLDGLKEAELAKRLRLAGAILVGKNNLHEFAFGVTSENENFGPVRNPWNRAHIPGGSSGGSAAAVVAGLCFASIGTDTRGSIRIPSACCGATGLKPTLNRISTRGVVPLSWTLDHAGPIARSVEDVELILEVLSGRPPRRTTSYPRPLPLSGLTLGISSYYFSRISVAVEKAVLEAIDLFRETGAKITTVEISGLEEVVEASDIISRAEAITFHDVNLKQHGDLYGPLVRQRLLSGHEVSGMELVSALRIRQHFIRQMRRLFRSIDVLVAPTLPVTAPPLGSLSISPGAVPEPIVQGLVRLNAPQNMAGIPALSLPCGHDNGDLPIGLQLITWRNCEDKLFALGKHFQKQTEWHRRIPPQFAPFGISGDR